MNTLIMSQIYHMKNNIFCRIRLILHVFSLSTFGTIIANEIYTIHNKQSDSVIRHFILNILYGYPFLLLLTGFFLTYNKHTYYVAHSYTTESVCLCEILPNSSACYKYLAGFQETMFYYDSISGLIFVIYLFINPQEHLIFGVSGIFCSVTNTLIKLINIKRTHKDVDHSLENKLNKEHDKNLRLEHKIQNQQVKITKLQKQLERKSARITHLKYKPNSKCYFDAKNEFELVAETQKNMS